MSLGRRKGSRFWWYTFTVRGARFRGSTETESRDEAQIIEADLRRQVLLGGLSDKRPEITLNEACARYWTEHARWLPSAPDLARHSRNLLRLIGKETQLSKIDSDVVAAFIARRRGEPAKGRGGALVSNRTVNADVVHLRAIMERARTLWKRNVEDAVQWSKLALPEPEGRDRHLSLAEAKRLLEACAPHLRPIVETGIMTGLRLQDLLTLDWRDVDMTARTITRRVKSRRPGGKLHVLPIPDPLLVLLANLGPADRGPVFTYTRPHPSNAATAAARAALERHGGNVSAAARELRISDNGLRKRLAAADKTVTTNRAKYIRSAWLGALRRAGIEDFRFHDLRHTCGTWLRHQGVPLEVIQKILGHADIRTTMRYAHHGPSEKDEAMKRLGHSVEAALYGSHLPSRASVNTD